MSVKLCERTVERPCKKMQSETNGGSALVIASVVVNVEGGARPLLLEHASLDALYAAVEPAGRGAGLVGRDLDDAVDALEEFKHDLVLLVLVADDDDPASP